MLTETLREIEKLNEAGRVRRQLKAMTAPGGSLEDMPAIFRAIRAEFDD